ncbi:hypothetical protein ACIPSA_41665 [Streptomyces sp. NPDC086549]|uniref:hypothetical protein n=1 Tax=Streptomyces sp. NPDC086549 TaxID=3365752 RepID=UPI00382230B2
MHRLRTATWAALPLLLPLLAAGPASAASSSPTLPLRSVRSVHPGDTLTAIAKDGQAAYGDTVSSSVFLAAGKLRMMAPLLTATVTIACDARTGTYPVLLNGAGAEGPAGHPFHWAQVRVEPADEAARSACRDKVKKMPPPDREERWAADDTWPQSPWDVRTFKAGSRITITDNDDEGSDGYITLSSRAFTDRPVLRGAKAVLTATTTLKCDAVPGLYVVDRHDVGQKGPDRVWARLRIAPAARAGACSTQAAHSSGASRTALVAWSAGGVLLASAVGAALLLRARSRRPKST